MNEVLTYDVFTDTFFYKEDKDLGEIISVTGPDSVIEFQT